MSNFTTKLDKLKNDNTATREMLFSLAKLGIFDYLGPAKLARLIGFGIDLTNTIRQGRSLNEL